MFSKTKGLHFGSVSNFMIFVSEDYSESQKKRVLQMESTLGFFPDFFQNRRDKALKIRKYNKPSH